MTGDRCGHCEDPLLRNMQGKAVPWQSPSSAHGKRRTGNVDFLGAREKVKGKSAGNGKRVTWNGNDYWRIGACML